MRLEIEPLRLGLREPLQTSYGTLTHRDLLTVRLTGTDGLMGTGEAAPLEPYDGVSLQAVRVELEGCREALAAAEPETPVEVLEACRPRCSLSQSLAALDLAAWDLHGRRAQAPVAALLADAPLTAVAVSHLVGATDPPAAAERAAELAVHGARCLKLKVGMGDDDARVHAVRRAAGAHVALRLDANGAWTESEAVAVLRRLALHRIELCEEPVHGIDALGRVREQLAGEPAIAMDETAAQPGAIEAGVADAVCLKIARCGGISGVMDAAQRARATGVEVYLGSTLDGPAGIAAALHAAAALRITRPSGLATLTELATPTMPVPTTPGLGLPADNVPFPPS